MQFFCKNSNKFKQKEESKKIGGVGEVLFFSLYCLVMKGGAIFFAEDLLADVLDVFDADILIIFFLRKTPQ